MFCIQRCNRGVNITEIYRVIFYGLFVLLSYIRICTTSDFPLRNQYFLSVATTAASHTIKRPGQEYSRTPERSLCRVKFGKAIVQKMTHDNNTNRAATWILSLLKLLQQQKHRLYTSPTFPPSMVVLFSRSLMFLSQWRQRHQTRPES